MVRTSMALASIIAAVFMGVPSAHAQAPVWTPPTQPLNSYAALDRDDDIHPRIATNTSGTAIAAWVKPTSIAFARSENGGTTWTHHHDIMASATTVNRVDVAYAGNATWVALAVTDIPEVGIPQNSGLGQVIMLRSTDDGHTWSDPQTIYSGELLPVIDIASDTSGSVIASINTLILRSADFGVSWSSSNPVPSTEGSMPFESHITCTGSGSFVHVYRNYVYSQSTAKNQLRTAISTDSGANWQDNVALEMDYWTADLRLGDIAAEGNTVVIAQSAFPPGPPWDQNRIEVLVSNDGGISFSTPRIVTLGDFTQFDISLAIHPAQYVVNIDPGYSPIDKSLQSYASKDGGHTWQPAPWPDSPGAAELQPTASFLPGGELLALYQSLQAANPNQPGADGDVIAATLSPDQTTWTVVNTVNANPTTDLPNIDDMDVDIEASPHGTILAAWTAQATNNFVSRGSRIAFRRSANFGKSWSTIQFVTPDSSPQLQGEGEPGIVFVGGTTWFAHWKSLNGFDTQYYSSTSTDDGMTWSEPALLNAQHVASNRNGMLVKALVAFEDPDGFDYYDLLVTFSRSTDAGSTWDTTSTIYVYSMGFVQHLEHIGGSTWMLAYKNGLLQTTNDGVSWGTMGTPGADIGGMHHVASNHNGVVMAIVSAISFHQPQPAFETYSRTSTDYGLTWDIRSIEKQTERNSGFEYNTFPEPRVTWIGSTKWMAVWHTKDFSDTNQSQATLQAHYSITEDNGITWSPPTPIASAETTPPIGQLYPDIATAQGKVVVGWQTYADPTGLVPPLGYDSEIFYSTTTIPGFSTAAEDWQLFE